MTTKIYILNKSFHKKLLDAYNKNILTEQKINLNFTFNNNNDTYFVKFTYENAFDIYKNLNEMHKKIQTIYLYDNFAFNNLNRKVLSVNGIITSIFTYGTPIKYFNILEQETSVKFVNKYLHVNNGEDITANITKLQNKLLKVNAKSRRAIKLHYRAIPILNTQRYVYNFVSRYIFVNKNLIASVRISI